jgi:hypothetical protein
MNKLIASIASISACLSAGAVSVCSYFPSAEVVSSPQEVYDPSGQSYSIFVSDNEELEGSEPVVTFTTPADHQPFQARLKLSGNGWQFELPSNSATANVEYPGYATPVYSIFDFIFNYDDGLWRLYIFGAFDSYAFVMGELYLPVEYEADYSDYLEDFPFQLVYCVPPDVYSSSLIASFAFPEELFNNGFGLGFRGSFGFNLPAYYYSQGENAGYTDGYSDGNSAGYNTGHEEGYNGGYEEGYNAGYNSGHEDSYNFGYNEGYKVGVTDGSKNFGIWDLFSNAFGSIGNVLNIQLFPGVTLGLILSVPIVFAFLLWLIHVLRG